MNRLAKLLLTVLLAADALAQVDVPGVKVEKAKLAREFTAGVCDDGSGRLSVCSTCTDMSICLNGVPVGPIACNGTYSWCNQGNLTASCSTTPATGCGGSGGGEPTSVVCPSLGVLPDPGSCSFYHVCRQVGSNSDVYVCPQGTSFNLVTQQCRIQSVANCVPVTCGDTSGFQYYGNSRQYYVYCLVVANARTPYIFKCPNRATFNMNTKSCVYSCPGQGNYANSDDPSTYYQCYILNGRYVSDLMRCPLDTNFNQTLRYCV